jgi:ferredoxin-NADP reductase
MSKKSKTQMAKIVERVGETKDTVTLRLVLPEPFPWQPGQFIMVQAMIDGKSVRRAYSVSSSPTRSDYMEITIRQTEEPTMSKYLNDIQVGDELSVRGPYGKFIWTEEVSDKAFFIAAGSGITPFRAFLQYVEDKELDNPIKLLYSCAHADNIIFGEELDDMVKELESVYYQLSLTREPEDKLPEIRKGRINENDLREQVKGFEDANYYICGAPGFVGAMMDLLTKVGIDPEQQHREQWG